MIQVMPESLTKWISFFAMGLIVLVLATGCSTGSALSGEQYLLTAKKIMEAEVGDIEQYGAFYLDREDGVKLVLALAKEDDKTDLLLEKLKASVPAEVLMVKTDYKYTVAELKKVNAALARELPRLRSDGNEIVSTYVDEPSDKVIIEARSLTDEGKTDLITEYGDKISFRIDPNLSYPSKTGDHEK